MKSLEPNEVWVTLHHAIPILKKLTGNTYTRQTLFNWANRGWLETNGYRPLKTTEEMLRNCIREHLQLRTEK